MINRFAWITAQGSFGPSGLVASPNLKLISQRQDLRDAGIGTCRPEVLACSREVWAASLVADLMVAGPREFLSCTIIDFSLS